MNANVHIPVGIAATTGMALAIPVLQCNSISQYAIYLGSATIGAIISDIDANGESTAKKEFRKIMHIMILATSIILIANYLNGTLEHTVISFITSIKGIGLLGFLTCCIIGYKSNHREFTHQLIGLLCFSICLIMFTNIKLGLWFGIGMLSHQWIDMLNKKKILWLYPLKINFTRYICKSSSKLSEIIGVISTILACIFLILLIK